ncbi:MAG: outer membrane beta-barrel protein [Chthoniobacterales bacterium]
MKKLILSLSAVIAMASVVTAGETYSKESKSVAPPPCPQWYADNEFNLTLSGAYAFTGTEWRDDRYLGVDHAWGGSLDAKYFVHRYFGFGFQGSLLFANTDDTFNNNNDDSNVVGTALGTFTLRFPISCSRFAPYVWGGGGGIFGGGNNNSITALTNNDDDHDSRWMGQVGGGFEVRFTPHCGWTNDFSWNIVEGTHNNFGMARTGINFAF